MKLFYQLALILLFSSLTYLPLHAQINTSALKKEAAGAGKLLTQLAGAIKPEAFLGSWSANKTGWLGKASKVAGAAQMASQVSSLAGFIKPGMFKSGFNVAKLMETAKTVKTMAGAASVVKNLEGGLKPEALTSSWKEQRGGWLSALNLLK